MIQKLNKYFKRPLGLILIVFYKGVLGFVEITLGALALIFSSVIRHAAGSDFIRGLIARELAEDPQGIFINWLAAHDPSGILQKSISLGLGLVILGMIDVAIAVAVWFRSWIVRDIGIIFFSGVAIYGIASLAIDFSFFKFLAVILNISILFYFWQMLPKHLGPRGKKIIMSPPS
ncbi:DUF2127 domain-containing protein [Candidatus Falkowbacteria bacterium]|nr:DUF2127 domain-containing protein [Candidatus Falkowbacteria bacterium]